MKSTSCSGLSLCVIAAALCAGAPLEAQRAWEWQGHGVVSVSDADFYGGGLGVGYRTDGRTRLQLLASVGDREGRIALRPEALVSFHLNPYKRQGVSPYAAGGIAFVINDGADAQYLIATLGLEGQPGRNWGWFVEAGLGGGVRIAAGVQLRNRTGRR